ncbi:menaquinone-dependent protoporphyrinogen IX dehydrogenase [Vibrio salinus]|uniref:menaquinone-dependent protoporphyrinogen IX dehydrogenase n=1 Tax=Vibrio salinus TaxID=2899784 RepID=UPI001E382041|nr:menaquinone-dependent protoporphyrinogen IX dehydrogenase [Vibrio salinus]MCE0493604.1 menaquinone-dependent protoporphyrinogen IX dehydrogenase [Vibrio salinus]
MDKVLFLYSTREGQTKKILKHIAEQLDNCECDFSDIHDMPDIDFSCYEKVLVGASIRYGHLHKKLYQFISQNYQALKNTKAAFVCVNLTARKENEGKDTPEGSVYIRTFLKKSQWQPPLIGVFAGALRYPRYRLFDKFMIQFIMKITGGETDISKEVEYTNWDKVKLFSDDFKKM